MSYFSRIERGLISKKRSVLEDKELFHKIRNLPTLPFIVTKVMEVMNNPRSSASDLAKIISSEQSLAAKVLRLVNSAYYGFPNPITTISHAVAILGFNTLRSLVLGISTHELFSKKSDGKFDRKELWLHSVATAIAAKALAKRVNYPNPEEMFLAGLLHDIGKVILDQHMHQDFIKAIETAKVCNQPLFEAEKEVFGAHHGEVGKYIADQWKLPAVLSEAIRWHHEVELAKDHRQIAAIVHVGNNMVKVLKIGSSGNYAPPVIHPAAAEILKMDQINVSDLTKEIQVGVRDCKAFLEIEHEEQEGEQAPA